MVCIMGVVNIVVVGLDEDVFVCFFVVKEFGVMVFVNGFMEDVVVCCQEICGKDNFGLVIECFGVNIVFKQVIDMLWLNGEVVCVGMGFKLFDFFINDIIFWNKSIIGYMVYDFIFWCNVICLFVSGVIKVKLMIIYCIGFFQWCEGFDVMVDKIVIKVIMIYDFDE